MKSEVWQKIGFFGLGLIIAVLFIKSWTPESSSDSAVVLEKYGIAIHPLPKQLSFAGENVPLEINDVTERLDRELTISTYYHSKTLLGFKKSARWFPLLDSILKSQDVPSDFKYLALIESDLSNAISPAAAVGFWQFLAETAKEHGLIVTDQIDERYHVEKATIAACKYFKDAYEKYGNWTLAAASYNVGKRRLSESLAEQNVENYYDLYLNEETSRYVFRILAAKYIMENPNQRGFFVKQSDLYQPYRYKIVEVDSSINNIYNFAITQGTNYKKLKELNPWLRQPYLKNSTSKVFEIKIPL